MSLVQIQQRAHAQSHDTLIMEARTALPLDGGVKCRQPEMVEDGRNRTMPKGETGQKRKKEKCLI